MLNVDSLTVVGLGYVGLPSAALMANAGYKVRGVDVNKSLIDELQVGHCRLGEEEVVEVVTKALSSGNLTAHMSSDEADAFIICVPTPVTADKTADVSMVTAAMKATAPFVRKGNLVILESTSPINTTRNVIAAALEEVGLDPYEDVDVCYCPERVFPGNTVNEILKNDRVVGGLTLRAAERAKAFYESFCEGTATPTTAAAAEFSKLMENTFRDVNIALANVFSHVAEQAGVDVMEVIRTANLHPRVNVHTPGPGVGGHCIPVDPWFLIESFPEVTQLLHASRKINDGQAEHFVQRAIENGLPSGAKVALLGAAYRGDIDDARDTPTELIIDSLAKHGFEWATHDPFVTHLHMHSPNSPNLSKDLAETVAGSDVAIIVTDHSDYKSLTPSDFVGMNTKRIIDTRRLLDAEAFAQAGFEVIRVGAPTLSGADA